MAVPHQARDYNIRILRSLAIYVEETYGKRALEEIASKGGIGAEQFDGRSLWVATSQIDALLAAARGLMDSDEQFMAAAAYRMEQAYGAMRFVLRAFTPANVFVQSIERFSMVSTVGTHEILETTRTSLEVRWTAKPAVSRLICLIRHGQAAALPTLWGLPPALFREKACMGLGDDSCIYHVSWYDKAYWLPSVVYGLVAAGAGFGVAHLGHGTEMLTGLFGVIGALVGYLQEVSASQRSNRKTDKLMIDALQQLVEQETTARTQMHELHRSERDWSRLLEEESRDRAGAIQKLTEHFQKMEESRTQIVRGYSHDLRNPLQVMRLGTGFLKDALGNADPQALKVIEEIDWSVRQMNDLLVELTKIAAQPTGTGQLVPQKLAIPTLTDRVRRRLQALAHGKDLRTSAFHTREAPATIEIDPLLFDRIVDNVLTNAVKYTERGSIVVEMDGSPGAVVIKVSDTGRGIAAADLEKTFTPGGSEESTRADHSLGIGLSVVVQLLAQAGGRLEVMSKPSVGTTFWLHLPVASAARRDVLEAPEQILKKVVSIRRPA